MRNFHKKIIIITVLTFTQLFPTMAFSQIGGGASVGYLVAQNASNPNWDQPAPNSDQGVNSGSKDMGEKLLIGTAVALGAGYLLYTYGQKLCGTGYGCAVGAVLIGMGVMALMQGNDYKGGMGGVNSMECASSASACASQKGLMANGALSAKGEILPFENKYIKVDPKNQKIIDKSTKKEYPFSAFGSASGMAAAGLGSGNIEKAMQIAADIQKKVENQYGTMDSGGIADGGGGGAATATVVGEDSSGNLNSYGANSKFKGPVSESASVAGLSKSLNGDPIGVSADDIFKMMNRRYLLKDKQESFLDVVSAKPSQ